MRNRRRWWFVVVLMLLLDLYIYRVVGALTAACSADIKLAIHLTYWSISVAIVVLILLLPYINYERWPKALRTYLFATIIGLFLAKLLASVFFLLDDVRRLLMWVVIKLFHPTGLVFNEHGYVDRSFIVSWLGIGAGITLFAALVYGFSNKYNYDVRRIKLYFTNFPKAFRGLRLVHISDIHSGSFTNKDLVQEGVDKIMQQQPDLILFTGDLVNDRATEMLPYINIFNQLKAPLGVYSTLGNHDYGEYVHWESAEAKRQNLKDLMDIHKQLGWRLLMNEHVALKKGDDAIALIGIENWSAKARFPKYGKLDVAYAGAESYPFKILMSHDPSHWKAEVLPLYPGIDLMLAGHTHGMQFGIDTSYFKWSPVQWVYKQWAGLYEESNQKLYVNRGFGFIGYPGRVGILPEITVIELV